MMNIRRLTKYRALVLAAEAGALASKASTPEEEQRVKDLLQEAESVIKQKPVRSLMLEQMLDGPHRSDDMNPLDLFRIDFECYRKVVTTAEAGVWGHGWTGNQICSRALARYNDAIQSLTFDESMVLLGHLMNFLYENHRNTGLGDTEPETAMTYTVNRIFASLGFRSIARGEWDRYLIRESQFA